MAQGLFRIRKQKKFFLSIASLIFLVAAVAISVYLVKQRQENRSFASSLTQPEAVLDSRIGVIHVAGTYPDRKAQGDFLQYGAKAAYQLGFQSLEIFIDPRVCRARPSGAYQTFKYCNQQKNTDMAMAGLAQLAQHPDFYRVLSMPFSRFQLTMDSIDPAAPRQWDIGGTKANPPQRFTAEQVSALKRDFYQFSKFLLNRFSNSGKTFVIMTPSELDWHLVNYTGCRDQAYGGDETACQDEPASPVAIANAIDYLNAIGAGIAQAKQEVSPAGMNIYHACEVNMVVRRSMRGKQSAMTDVIPKTQCELIAYSAHESRREALKSGNPRVLAEALDYIAGHFNDFAPFGDKNVFVSEFAFAYDSLTAANQQLVKNLIKRALDWGVPYFQFWQLYQQCDGSNCRDDMVLNSSGNQTGLYTNYLLPTFAQTPTPSLSPRPSASPIQSPQPSPSGLVSGNSSRFVSQQVPASMETGKRYDVALTFFNNGSKTWQTGDYTLGYVSQTAGDDRTWIKGREIVRKATPSGNEYTFSFRVVAPSQPGFYRFEWQLLERGEEWFGDKSPSLLIEVK